MNPGLFFARLAEHDVRTETDGQHVDIRIASWAQHEGWNPELLINDIAMIKLAQDIIFNGKLVFFSLDFMRTYYQTSKRGHNVMRLL